MLQLTDKQKEYIRNANKRWNIKTGATGAGKTFLDVLYTIPARIRERAGKNGLVVLLGNTKGTLQRNIIEPMQELYGIDLVSSIRSDNTAMLFGEKCYCLGADNKKHVDRLRGSSIKYAYGDEITTWNEEVFDMLKSRLRTECSIFDGTCNPAAPNHWVKEFIDSDADIFCQAYAIDDNPSLPEFYVEQLKREYAGTVYYDRYILGKWAMAEGLVYPMFDFDKHVISETPGGGLWYISIDYGTHNPFSAALWCITGEIAVRVKEYYYDSSKHNKQKTDEEYYSEIEELAKGKLIQSIVVDPSAASFIECIRRHGRFIVRGANNSVLDGIRNTATALSSGRIKVHESCRDFISEIQSYSWEDNENSTEDAVVKVNDHAMDDMRYFVQTIYRRVQPWSEDSEEDDY